MVGTQVFRGWEVYRRRDVQGDGKEEKPKDQALGFHRNDYFCYCVVTVAKKLIWS